CPICSSLKNQKYFCWRLKAFLTQKQIYLETPVGVGVLIILRLLQIAMKGFAVKIVDMMKEEKLFESQGGPIILAQIENDYGPIEYELADPARAYTDYVAKMVVGLGIGVPWVMCKLDDAPDPIVYRVYGPVPHRPAEDLAFTE
ncbi:hypothetical protein MKX01_002371, partial [Papaver californicum]